MKDYVIASKRNKKHSCEAIQGRSLDCASLLAMACHCVPRNDGFIHSYLSHAKRDMEVSMILPERFRKHLSKDKSPQELDAHYEGLELEKGDFLAMVIAAMITFFPVLLAIMAVVYGLSWLFLVK